MSTKEKPIKEKNEPIHDMSDAEMEYLLKERLPTPWDYESNGKIINMMKDAGYFDKEIAKGKKTIEKLVAEANLKMLKGKKLGIDQQTAFEKIYIIDGKSTCMTELMNAIIKRDCPQSIILFKETTKDRCVIVAKRPEDPEYTTTTYTMEDAVKMGHTKINGYMWANQPEVMIYNRCFTKMARRQFASEIEGLASYTPDELGAIINEEGEVIGMPEVPEIKPEPKTKGLSPKSVTKADIPKTDPPKKPAPQSIAQAEKANETKIIPKSEIKKEDGLNDPRLNDVVENPFEEDLKSGLQTTPAEVSANNQEFLKAELLKVCRSYRDKLVAAGMTEIEIDQAMEAEKLKLGDFYDPETALIAVMASKGIGKEAQAVQEPDQPERDVYRIDAIDQFKKKDGNNFYKLALTNPANGGQEAVVWFNFDISKLDPLSLKKRDSITAELEPGKPWKKKDGTEMRGDPIIKNVSKVG